MFELTYLAFRFSAAKYGENRYDKSIFLRWCQDSLLKYAVIIALFDDKLIYCKHKGRDTYEIPGGHRELGETILETARRELREETGAAEFAIKQVCVYSVSETSAECSQQQETTYGALFIAEVSSFEELCHEIEEIRIAKGSINNWTYPHIQPQLLAEAQRRGFLSHGFIKKE